MRRTGSFVLLTVNLRAARAHFQAVGCGRQAALSPYIEKARQDSELSPIRGLDWSNRSLALLKTSMLLMLGVPMIALGLGVLIGSTDAWRSAVGKVELRRSSHSLTKLCPVQRSFGIELHLVDFPGQFLLLRCPEAIGCNLADVSCFREGTSLRWVYRDNRWSLTEQWANLAYRTEVSASGPWVDIDFVLENRSSGSSGPMGVTNCLSARGCPLFADKEMARTFLRRSGKWVALRDCVAKDAQGLSTCQNWIDFEPDPGKPPTAYWNIAQFGTDEPLIAVESEDRAWTLIFAFLPSDGLMNNCEYPCIHAQTRLPDTAAGESAHAAGRIGVIAGDKDVARSALRGWFMEQSRDAD